MINTNTLARFHASKDYIKYDPNNEIHCIFDIIYYIFVDILSFEILCRYNSLIGDIGLPFVCQCLPVFVSSGTRQWAVPISAGTSHEGSAVGVSS